MHPGEGPGLGVEIDETLAAQYPYDPAYLPVEPQAGRDAAQLVDDAAAGRHGVRDRSEHDGTHQTRRTEDRRPHGARRGWRAAARRAQQMTQATPIAQADQEAHHPVGLPVVLRQDAAHGRSSRASPTRGLTAVDLLNEEQWTSAKEFGLTCSMGYVGAGCIHDGPQRPEAPRHARQRLHDRHSRRPRRPACPT